MGYRNSKRYSYKRKLRRNRYRLSNETIIEKLLQNSLTTNIFAGLIVYLLTEILKSSF